MTANRSAETVLRRRGDSALFLIVCASAVSRSSPLNELTSLAQSEKVYRNPWAVMSPRFIRRSIIASAHVRQRAPVTLPRKDRAVVAFSLAQDLTDSV